MFRYTELIAFALELLGIAFVERLAITFIRLIRVPAIELAIAHTRLLYASFVIASERMLSAWNGRTQFNRFIAPIDTVLPTITTPPQRNASIVFAFEFVRRTCAICFIRTIGTVVIAITDILFVDAQILIGTFELGAGHTRDIAIVFVTEIRTVVHAVAALGTGYTPAIGTSKFGFGTIAHRAIHFVTFVHTIEMIITIPTARDALSIAASVDSNSEEFQERVKRMSVGRTYLK